MVCQKPSCTRQCCYKQSEISIALGKKLFFHGKWTFETFILWAVSSSLDTSENFLLAKISPKEQGHWSAPVDLLVLHFWLCGIQLLLLLSADSLLSLLKLKFVRGSVILLNMIEAIKLTLYNGPGWTLDKHVFGCVFSTWQSSELVMSWNKSSLFKYNLPGLHNLDKQRCRTIVPQNIMGKKFTISANGTLMSAKQKIGA